MVGVKHLCVCACTVTLGDCVAVWSQHLCVLSCVCVYIRSSLSEFHHLSLCISFNIVFISFDDVMKMMNKSTILVGSTTPTDHSSIH